MRDLKINQQTVYYQLCVPKSVEDKNGNKRIAVEVIVEQASFCGEKVSANNAEPNYTQASSDDFEEISGDEDLPF